MQYQAAGSFANHRSSLQRKVDIGLGFHYYATIGFNFQAILCASWTLVEDIGVNRMTKAYFADLGLIHCWYAVGFDILMNILTLVIRSGMKKLEMSCKRSNLNILANCFPSLKKLSAHRKCHPWQGTVRPGYFLYVNNIINNNNNESGQNCFTPLFISNMFSDWFLRLFFANCYFHKVFKFRCVSKWRRHRVLRIFRMRIVSFRSFRFSARLTSQRWENVLLLLLFRRIEMGKTKYTTLHSSWFYCGRT